MAHARSAKSVSMPFLSTTRVAYVLLAGMQIKVAGASGPSVLVAASLARCWSRLLTMRRWTFRKCGGFERLQHVPWPKDVAGSNQFCLSSRRNPTGLEQRFQSHGVPGVSGGLVLSGWFQIGRLGETCKRNFVSLKLNPKSMALREFPLQVWCCTSSLQCPGGPPQVLAARFGTPTA